MTFLSIQGAVFRKSSASFDLWWAQCFHSQSFYSGLCYNISLMFAQDNWDDDKEDDGKGDDGKEATESTAIQVKKKKPLKERLAEREEKKKKEFEEKKLMVSF